MFTKRSCDQINYADNKIEVNTIWDICGKYLSDVLHEITHDTELLRECYCEHRIREFDRKFLPQIFSPSDELADFSDIPVKPLSEIARMLDSRAILVLGDVGTGKSTFVHHFFKVHLPSTPKWDIYEPIFIDFKGVSTADDVVKYAIDTIDEELKKLLKDKLGDSARDYSTIKAILGDDLFWNEGLYKQFSNVKREDLRELLELNDMRRFIQDTRHYNRRRMQYYERTFGKLIVVILDNVDHLYEPEKVEAIYLFGQSLVKNASCRVVMTMRTYNAYGYAHHYDPYSAFNPRYLHLSLPNVLEMIHKRISVGISSFRKRVQLQSEGNVRVSVNRDTFSDEMQAFLESFSTDTIIRTLKKLSYYDLRELLRLTHRALASGHIYPKERRERYQTIRNYDLLQSLMLGNWLYYNPKDEQPAIINLFDDNADYDRGKLIIRYYLLNTVRYEGTNNVDIRRIIDRMINLGFEAEDVLTSLQVLINHSLISPLFPTGLDLTRDNIVFVSLTDKGSYYIDELLLEPRYYEIMRFASHMEMDFWEIMSTYSEAKEDDRYRGTSVFIEFLRDYETKWVMNKIKDKDLIHHFPSLHLQMKKSFNKYVQSRGKNHLAL